VAQALVVSDLNIELGQVINLHFCRSRYEDGKKVKGCDDVILSSANLKNYLESNDKYQRPVIDAPVKEVAPQPVEDLSTLREALSSTLPEPKPKKKTVKKSTKKKKDN
jgi:hypothetical protein